MKLQACLSIRSQLFSISIVSIVINRFCLVPSNTWSLRLLLPSVENNDDGTQYVMRRKSINSEPRSVCTKAQALEFTAPQMPAHPFLPDPRFIYVLCIVEFLFIVQVFCLQEVIVNGTWLNGINEIQDGQTCTNLWVLHREKAWVLTICSQVTSIWLKESEWCFPLKYKYIHPGVGNATVSHMVFQTSGHFCRGVTSSLLVVH